ncbi:TetR/AcrR family transcriptional regulator, partial [Saccharothrix algeriensis]
QKLLDAAGELMRGQGYGAMSVAGICELAGVRKGSFYHFFDSKQVLAVEALRAAWAAEEALWKEILRSSGRPLHRLERLLLAHAARNASAPRQARERLRPRLPLRQPRPGTRRPGRNRPRVPRRDLRPAGLPGARRPARSRRTRAHPQG